MLNFDQILSGFFQNATTFRSFPELSEAFTPHQGISVPIPPDAARAQMPPFLASCSARAAGRSPRSIQAFRAVGPSLPGPATSRRTDGDLSIQPCVVQTFTARETFHSHSHNHHDQFSRSRLPTKEGSKSCNRSEKLLLLVLSAFCEKDHLSETFP